MIFVTVGTHEQQFNRLIQYIDELHLPDVFMQIGYCDYIPKNCRYEKMIGFEEMNRYATEADIVITHGGPGSIMLPLQMGKVPIVVPRQYKFGEHINDHQVYFARHLEKNNKILAIYDIAYLKDAIEHYSEKIESIDPEIQSNNRNFNQKFKELVDELYIPKKKRLQTVENTTDLLRCTILSVPILVSNMKQTVDYIDENLEQLQGKYICVSNVHTTVMAYEDAHYQKIQKEAAMVLPDGKPLSIVCRRRGYKQAHRVAGPDLMPEIFKLSEEKGYTHYFYGSTEQTLSLLREQIVRTYPKLKIVGSYSPPFCEMTIEEDQEISKMIHAVNPDFIWVGLGAPKQEKWMWDHKDRFTGLMIGVGAAFDFHAGTVKRAPKWIQELCMEWLYRLIQDPRRLFKRYIRTNFKFVYLVFKGY